MNIGLNLIRPIKGTRTNKYAIAGDQMVKAPQVGAAFVAEEDIYWLAAAGSELKRLRHEVGFNEFPFDPEINYEGATCNALTITTMTSVNDQRQLGQFVSDGAAGAPTFEGLVAHNSLL